MRATITQGNIYQTLIDDSIKRRDDLKNFLKILDSVEEGFSIALQGNWGCGKTFFVKQLKMILDAFNSDKSDLDEEKIRRIREIFSDGESVNKYTAKASCALHIFANRKTIALIEVCV